MLSQRYFWRRRIHVDDHWNWFIGSCVDSNLLRIRLTLLLCCFDLVCIKGTWAKSITNSLFSTWMLGGLSLLGINFDGTYLYGSSKNVVWIRHCCVRILYWIQFHLVNPMLLGLFILRYLSVSDPWYSDIGMALKYFIFGVKLNI